MDFMDWTNSETWGIIKTTSETPTQTLIVQRDLLQVKRMTIVAQYERSDTNE